MSSKEIHNWANLAIFCPCRYDDEKTRHNLTKNSKVNPFVVNSVLDSNCKQLKKRAIRENFTQKTWPIERKLSFQLTRQTLLTNNKKKKRSVSNFLHLRLNNIWAPCPRLRCTSKKSNFSSFLKTKYFSNTNRPTNNYVEYYVSILSAITHLVQ